MSVTESQPTATNGAPNPEVAAVAAIPQRVVDAWAANDGDAFADLFTEDATILLPGGVYGKGRETIRQWITAGYAGPYKGTRVYGEPIDLRFITPTVAVIVTEGGVLGPGETTVAPEQLIRATWTCVKREDGWYLAAYHNCNVN
ncbi:MAG TPA: SgcJ/EcaC family oxidoreductase [Pseudonocardiaceae bacterium]|nr:SgcJ/EcaC family oxidoreductase [Pseudonocardiaceae bacterium]